ncbi:o-succinylbenzoate synthase [Calothrix sp. 336/3]|uniref:o-succinylbenzoate synthase n=1 Tax=Calothrix sp. 336/3 TaxID=1337936 RepID=UPI0004E2EF6E|nr:o-succinylbenzoate synthase [Calothrix sp. 336/3]AKG22313.1 O-succinylbenzoate synthase [Calothrix sp. 336/3]
MTNHYQFTFRCYQRKFIQPVITSYGKWQYRRGIVIRLTDDRGKIGWGEIAPIPWFGSEKITAALAFCREINTPISREEILAIPSKLPACQFAFESALEEIENHLLINLPDLECSGLLPAGDAALTMAKSLYQQGYKTFKWKIAVYPVDWEIDILHRLIESLPLGIKLRLDANGGLNLASTKQWLETCEQINRQYQIIEFIEQPLPVNCFDETLGLSHDFSVKIALDESVANLSQLIKVYHQGWQGIYVVKAGIFGSPSRLGDFLRRSPLDCVFSSVFETSIGRKSALNLAKKLSAPNRAVGFGIHHYFAEDEIQWINQLW